MILRFIIKIFDSDVKIYLKIKEILIIRNLLNYSLTNIRQAIENLRSLRYLTLHILSNSTINNNIYFLYHETF